MIRFDASTLRPRSLAQSFWQESGYARAGSCIDFSLAMHIGKLWFPVLSACNDCIMFSLWDINL